MSRARISRRHTRPRCTAQHRDGSHRVAGRPPASLRGQRERPIATEGGFLASIRGRCSALTRSRSIGVRTRAAAAAQPRRPGPVGRTCRDAHRSARTGRSSVGVVECLPASWWRTSRSRGLRFGAAMRSLGGAPGRWAVAGAGSAARRTAGRGSGGACARRRGTQGAFDDAAATGEHGEQSLPVGSGESVHPVGVQFAGTLSRGSNQRSAGG
jgi:hypothetical protein